MDFGTNLPNFALYLVNHQVESNHVEVCLVMGKIVLWIWIVLIVGLVLPAFSTTVNISGTADTDDATLYSNATADNAGAGTTNRAGRTNTTDLRRLLIRFNLFSIPTTASIDSVSLSMTVNNVPPFAPSANHALYRVINSWSEGTGIGTGTNGQIANGGVSWTFRQYPTVLWTSTGGDFSNTPSDSINIGNTTGLKTWTGSGLTTDVQGWVNGSLSNFGWILLGDETVAQSARGYASSEDSVSPPVLTVNYTALLAIDSWEAYGK